MNRRAADKLRDTAQDAVRAVRQSTRASGTELLLALNTEIAASQLIALCDIYEELYQLRRDLNRPKF